MTLRRAALGKLFMANKIPPDLTTIMALRELHDEIVNHNENTQWLLDRKASSARVQ